MDTLMQDLRYALRTLSRSPGFTLAAVVTLGLGIGANTAIFSVVDRLLFRPYPFMDTRPLMAVWSVGPRGNDHNEISPADFKDFRAESRSFDHLVAHTWWTANLTGQDSPERVQGFRVSPDYFEALGIRPVLGRSFVADEDQVGKDRVAVLSHGLWQRRFGGDSAVIGTTIGVNGIVRTIVGVMPDGVRYPAPAEIWAPLSYVPEDWARRVAHVLYVTGRLAPGATSQSAQAEIATIASRLATQFPETNAGWSGNVQPLVHDLTRQIRPMLFALFGAVGFVLLIACANVANLLLTRATARQREITIRTALGAGRGRITQLMLAESISLALFGAIVVGLPIGVWGMDILVALVPGRLRRSLAGLDHLSLDGVVLGFALGLALLAAVLFGLVPALRAARAAGMEPLRGGIAGRERHRLRRSLVSVEVALALLLLVGAGLTLRAFRYLGSIDPGFEANGVAVTSLALGRSYPDDAGVARFYTDLIGRVSTLPGVSAAGAANILPLCGCNQTSTFGIPGTVFRRGQGPEVGWRVATPGYFEALHIPLIRGRAFAASDDAAAPTVAVVNEATSRRWFPNGGALGKRVYPGGDTTRLAEVVGIVGDVRHGGLAQDPEPELYVAAAQFPTREMTLVVRTGTDPATTLAPVRAAVLAIDPDQSVYDQQSMDQVLDNAMGPYRFSLDLLAALGVVALVLAGVGIYGVIAHVVAERTREIGIRMALGGDQRAVSRMVVRQGMAPAAVGLIAGLIAAVGVSVIAANRMVGVHAGDPVTLMMVSAVLLGVALVACWIPARRAARVDPMVALRSE